MKDKKYFLGLLVVVTVFVIYEINRPIPLNWEATYHQKHQRPFGTYALHELLKEEPTQLKSVFKTNYELIVNDSIDDHLLILANTFAPGKSDALALFKYVESGKTVMVHALNYQGVLADSLGIVVSETLGLNVPGKIERVLTATSKASIRFKDEDRERPLSEIAMSANFFEHNESAEVLATNENNEAVLLRYAYGEGQLILSTTPLLLTNYFILQAREEYIAAKMMSFFPENSPILHNEYYAIGNLESETPLRILLREEALRAATYLSLVTGLLFLVFKSKREQRPIPEIQPLRNTSLDFAHTLGRLYYRQFNHQKLALKRLMYWKEYVHRHFLLALNDWDVKLMNELIHKSGKPKENIHALFLLFEKVEKKELIKKEELLELEKQLNKFYGKE